MTRSIIIPVAMVLLLGIAVAGHAEDKAAPDQREAKKVFGAVRAAPPLPPQSIGRYDLGCVAGAKPLPATASSWQVMRLSRNRFWGHPVLLAYIEKLAEAVKSEDGSNGLLVGDMAQPIGGPLLGGHASHQTGIDVDLWYSPMPERTLSASEREKMAADNVIDPNTLDVNERWTDAKAKLVQRAALFPEVARIFVHPGVKKALCQSASGDRGWLAKIRPWYKHDDHFHVRLNCPADSAGCKTQPPISTADDGCGAELDEWFKKLRTPAPRPPKPLPPPKPLLVSDLPDECQALLHLAEPKTAEKAAVDEINSPK